ncbi:hypothetical protein V6N12_056009 [Hibiscus sabdariffa]|uniref:DNA/RNA-binding protein Alba-like domain-containing protein n=1 Tax=Hibiscus sabdariffa TaxID=183260 RepID=A0ABR2CRA7_9ROSI
MLIVKTRDEDTTSILAENVKARESAKEIVLKATGTAINKTVMIAELIKRRIGFVRDLFFLAITKISLPLMFGNIKGDMVDHRDGGLDGGQGYGGRGRGRGRGWGRGFRGYGGGNMQRDSGHYNGNGPDGPFPGQGRGKCSFWVKSLVAGGGRGQGLRSDGAVQKAA